MRPVFLGGSGREYIRAAAASILVLAAVLAGCTPGSEIIASESDVVTTMHDPAFAFGGVQTYALADTIVHLTGDENEPDSPLLSRAHDDEILADVAAHFDALGWTRVNDPQADNPDVVVVLAGTAIANFSAYYPYYPYWGWYYPGYCPGCYWSYPTVVYAYTTGTLLIQLFEPTAADEADGKVTTRWLAAVNGVLDDSDANLQKRVDRGIDQAFDQSPYLAGE